MKCLWLKARSKSHKRKIWEEKEGTFSCFIKAYLNKDTMSSPVLFKSSSGSIHRIAAFWNTYIAYFKKKQKQITASDFLCLINTLKTPISHPNCYIKVFP